MSGRLGLYGSAVSDEKAYACTHCLAGERPVLYVVREAGDLVLACGGDDHAQSADDWKIVHLGHLIEQDASFDPLPELSDGYEAERDAPHALWHTRPLGG